MASNSRYEGCSFFSRQVAIQQSLQWGSSPSALQGNGIGAKAIRVGPEGKCNRKGAVATSVRLEAKKDRRMLILEEANVGTEDNNHTDDLNMVFAHLS